VGYFGNFQKTAKVNYHPRGENSPNLFTLMLSYIFTGKNDLYLEWDQ
jgi:hypothetical protein